MVLRKILTVNYINALITATGVIEEVIKLAKEIKEMDQSSKNLKLTEYEYAFYSAVADNESARELMKKDKLRELAINLTEQVKNNASIDWTKKESVKAKLRVSIRRTLRKFGYPPDMEELAVDNTLKQAELIAEEITR